MMDDTVHILLIEDDPAHAELIQRAFEDRGGQSRLTVANTLEEASQAERSGGGASDFYFLAMSYHRLGELHKAEEFFTKAVKWTQSHSEAFSRQMSDELEAFRREAEETLGKPGSQ